jgi:uncharacterized protein (TIGR02145 family)
MKKYFYLIAILLTLPFAKISCKEVDSLTALIVAKNYFFEVCTAKKTFAIESILPEISSIIKGKENRPLLYFVNIKDGGYVVISGDTRAYPVLSYNENDNWNAESIEIISPGERGFIYSYANQIQELIEQGFPADNQILNLWDHYKIKNLDSPKAPTAFELTEMGNIHWNQTQYYNEQCPQAGGTHPPALTGYGGRVPAGCVAVAMAQIMKFWQWPSNGNGSNSYTDPSNPATQCGQLDPSYGSQSANFSNASYVWSSMPNSLSATNTEVAEIIRHAGVSVDMDYAYCGSGAYDIDARDAFVNNFKFSSTADMRDASWYSWSTWEEMIVAELDSWHPVYYRGESDAGSGHAFVSYAYNYVNPYYLFKFNWGWGGSGNGTWYTVRSVSGQTQITYHHNQKMITGLYPTCLSCPGWNFQISPTTSWQTHSSSHVSDGCQLYKISVVNGSKYTFKTGCGNGATANYDTFLELMNSSCSLLTTADDECESNRSSLEWTSTYSGYAYLKVRGYAGLGGTYTLAYSYCITPSQPGAISGNSNPCQGSSQTYSISPVSGATSYTWTLPSGWNGSSTSTSITAIVGGNSGSISVTANNSCGSSTARTLPVTVTATPSQPGTISGNTTVCQSSSQTYSISSVSGATSYTWTLPSGWSGSSNSTSINAIVGSSGGTISVTANNSCGSSAARTLPVTVNTIPAQPGNITGPTTVCQGSSQTYSISSVSGATSYTWTLPSGWSGSSTSTSITATVGANSGSICVTANNSCGTSPLRCLSVTVSPIPAQPGNISGNTTPCQGSSQTYSISSVSGATSYTWTLPSGWSGSSTSTSITVTVGANSGSICVTANNSCGTSPSRCLSVTVSPVPAQPGNISGNTSPCQGTSETYSISSVSGATSYTWTLPSGWSGSSTSTSITVTVGANSGSICVTANNSCGTSPSRCLSVTVSPVPAQPGNISGNSTPCQGTSETYSISPVSGATSYTWALPSGWSGSSTSTSITTAVGANSGSVCVTANNSCGSSPPRCLSVTVSPVPAQPGNISGNSNPCQGTSETYSISPVSGATSYTWTLPSGWSGSSTSTSITTAVGANSGSICVTANNSCGSSPSRCLSVTVSPVPAQPGNISGNSNPCQGTSETYNISPVSGATSYTWTLPSGWSGSSTSTSITATVGANSGSICVTANNSCGSSPSRCLGVTVSPVPSQPGNISGNTNPCQGTSQTYAISPVSGATSYTWTLPSGWSGSSTSTSITTVVGSNNGTITVSANNSCGAGPTRALNVTVGHVPTQPGSIAGNTTVAQGTTQTYSISPVTGADTYTWTLPSGWSGSSTSTSITATVGTTGGIISVTATNTCGTSPASSINVNVTSSPVIIVSPQALTFGEVLLGSDSPAQSYNVQGSNLTTAISVIAPSGFTISLSVNGPWTSSLSLPLSGGIVNTNVFVRFSPTSNTNYSGNITNASTGAPTQNVAVSGTGIDIPSLVVNPSSRSVSSAAGSTTYSVTTNASWSAVSDQTWCTVTPSGNGNGTITATYLSNTTNLTRTALITVSATGLSPVVVTLTQAGSEFIISAQNLIQTAPNILEFDVYLLDLDASAPFELASVQLGFLLNSGIHPGGTLSANYTNNGSGLLTAQQFTALASVVSPIAGYPNQTLIRLAGKTPPGTGNGTIISTVSPGTLLTHFILTSSVPFANSSTANLTFTSNTVTIPLYATRVAAYIGGINTQLEVIPGSNALITENPLLNGPPMLSVNPLIQNVGSGSGSTSFTVNSNAAWTVQSNQTWCTVTPSGFGNGILTASYSENTGSARAAQITVSVTGLNSVVLTLNQQGYEIKVLNLYALIEGLYNGNGTMRQANDENGPHFAANVADMVNIELHNAEDYGIIHYTVVNAALGTNGIVVVNIPEQFSEDYYITIKHRNSIETTTAVPVSFAPAVINYAFDIPAKAHGNNLQLMIDSYYAIYGGDVNTDDFVDTGDMTMVDNESNNYSTGYISEDVNGDGQIDTGDMIVIDNNAANYVGGVFPIPGIVLMATTLPVSNITRTSAVSGGNIISQGALPVTARGVCWGTSLNPTVSGYHTTDGSGPGSFVSSLSGLTPGTLYHIRAYATNSNGTVYGDDITFYTILYINGTGLTDFNGNSYPSVIFGTQEWMSENLKVKNYRNGEIIPNVIVSSEWNGLTSGAYCWYNNDEATYKNTYGALYNWYAVTDSRNLCPAGWRTPVTDDWTTLAGFLGGTDIAGGKMKSTRTFPEPQPRWDQPNFGATNISGYNGFPGGYRLQSGIYEEIGRSGYWWNSTVDNSNLTWMRALNFEDDDLGMNEASRKVGFSVRCIKEISLPILSTNGVTNITGITANGGGVITSDGGSPVTQRGVCWSTSPDPTIDDNITINGSGTGSFESSITGLSINTTYYVRAYAMNGAGVSYGTNGSISFKTMFYIQGNGATDLSGNEYSSVILGNQEWMVENLKTAKYSNGDIIPNTTSGSEWIALTTGAWAYYNNNAQLENPYGKLYNWYAVTDPRQLCPSGWHIPSDSEWTVLTDFLGGIYQADERMKEADFAHWNPSGYNGDNSSGFTGLPGGRRYYSDGSFLYMTNIGYWWSSTQATSTTAWCRALGYNYSGVNRGDYFYKNGNSVRCIRQVTQPSLSTAAVSQITGSTALSGGNVTSDGGSPVTQRGICWSTYQNPTIADSHTSDGSGTGAFISNLTGLTANTPYYVRAYAVNNIGIAYGDELSFTTLYEIPIDGLNAYYPFNDNANDESGNDNNGTVYGAVLTTDRFNIVNHAYYFDGSDDRITTSFNPSNINTISVWFNADPLQPFNAGIFSTYEGYSFSGYYFGFQQLLPIGTLYYDGNQGELISFPSWNQWTHLVVCCNGTSITVYVNGVLYLSFAGGTTHSGNLFIGDSKYDSRFFKGKIDDIRVYNYPLSASEIQALYHEGGW